jgi:hypothetical protein
MAGKPPAPVEESAGSTGELLPERLAARRPEKRQWVSGGPCEIFAQAEYFDQFSIQNPRLWEN